MKKNLLVLLCLTFVSLSAFGQKQSIAQNPKFGVDSASRMLCARNLTLFKNFIDDKNTVEATVALFEIIRLCPASSTNTYIHGAKLYKDKIESANSVELKDKLFDTLMGLYDTRIAHFGKDKKRGESYILATKAMDLITIYPDKNKEAATLFKKSIDLGGEEVELKNINRYFQILINQYKNEEITAEFLINEYLLLEEIMTREVEQKASLPNLTAKESFESLFTSSGAVTCESIEKIFSSKIDGADAATLEKVFNLLKGNKCTTDFMTTVSLAYYKSSPSVKVAVALAEMYSKKGDDVNALMYYENAMQIAPDSSTKASLALTLAGTFLQKENAKDAVAYSQKALSFDSKNSTAYYFLGNAYALGAGTACSDFNRALVFLMVVDNLEKAKEYSTDAAQIEKITQQINSTRAYFPSTEEMFFQNKAIGSAVNINCGWINGRTTIRTRN